MDTHFKYSNYSENASHILAMNILVCFSYVNYVLRLL